MPPMIETSDNRGLTMIELADAGIWLSGSPIGELTVQTLFQRAGFGMTLLVFDGEEEGGEDDVEDAYDRYSRWKSVAHLFMMYDFPDLA